MNRTRTENHQKPCGLRRRFDKPPRAGNQPTSAVENPIDEKQQLADDDELAHSSTDKAAILALKIAAVTGGPQRAGASNPRIPRDLLPARSASMLTEA